MVVVIEGIKNPKGEKAVLMIGFVSVFCLCGDMNVYVDVDIFVFVNVVVFVVVVVQRSFEIFLE